MRAIYKIENTVTKDFYIGSAVRYDYRKWSHLHHLRKGTHRNPILQNSWNKHGEDAFLFSIVEEIDDVNILIEREQYYIDTLNPRYNIARIAGNCLGIKRSNEARERMRQAHLGKKLSPESIAKRTLKQSGENHPYYGKPRSDEDKIRISEGIKKFYRNGGINRNTGRKASDELKEKLSKAHMIPVVQFSKTGEFIKEWEGATAAQNALGLHKTNINQCCRGKLKTSGGFIWKYKTKN